MIKLSVDKVAKGKAEKFEIESRSIDGWKLICDIPEDSAARSRDISIGMIVRGFIIPGYEGDVGDSTHKLADWCKVPSDKTDAYRKVILENITAGIVERHFEYPEAYVSKYTEKFSADSGDGEFMLEFHQRRGSTWNDNSTVIFNSKGYKAESKK